MPPIPDGLSRRGVLAAASACCCTLAGCLGGDGEGTDIHVDDVTFNPYRKEIEVGTTLTWQNRGHTAHTVTSTRFHRRAADWAFSADLAPEETTSYTFERDGLYEYYCEYHGEANECGVVVVGDASPPERVPCDVTE